MRATPPPWPPRVKAGRTTIGSPIAAAKPSASSTVCAIALSGIRRPAASMVSRKRSRSSARPIASASAPMSSTRNRSRVPSSASVRARFSAVWPPRVGRSASGRSRSMICVTGPGSSGSTYVAVANSGSVMIVAGFEFTRTTS